MACCTIPPTQKRALEFDLPRSKRRKCGTMYTIQPQTQPVLLSSTSTTTSPNIIIDAKAKKINPFQIQNDQQRLTNDELMERIRDEAKRFIKRKQLTISKPTTTSTTTNNNTIPLFSIEQVSQICEKMIKDREEYLKEQYDLILSQKLSEQYDAFVKFTHDQIQKRFEASNFSYVS